MYPRSSKPTSQKERIYPCVRFKKKKRERKKFWMCACARSTKAAVSCISAKPRLRAQVTLLYRRFPAGNERCVSRAWEKPQRREGCVLSVVLKKARIPHGKIGVKPAPDWNIFMSADCCLDFKWVSWEIVFLGVGGLWNIYNYMIHFDLSCLQCAWPWANMYLIWWRTMRHLNSSQHKSF